MKNSLFQFLSQGFFLTSIKRAGGEETPRFECNITKGGKIVATVSNDGCGGCNNVYTKNKELYNLIHKFEYEIFLLLDYISITKRHQAKKVVMVKYLGEGQFDISDYELYTQSLIHSISIIKKQTPSRIKNLVKKINSEGLIVINTNLKGIVPTIAEQAKAILA